MWSLLRLLATAYARPAAVVLGVVIGYGIPILLTQLSYRIDVAPDVEARFVELFDWLILVPPAALGLWWFRGRGTASTLRLSAFLGAAGGLLFVLMGYGMWGQHIFQGPDDYGLELYRAADTIAWVAPQITSAAYLDTKVSPDMRSHVSGHEPSTGPTVISVHQVDDQAWGAAALDPEAGCLLVLVDVSTGLRKAAQLRYGKLPADQPCTADHATRTTIADPNRGAWGCRVSNAGRIPGC